MVLEEKASKNSSERQQWQIIFNSLVKMLQTQQQQIQSLVEERHIFQDRFQSQHDRWVSDVEILEDEISQMKRKVTGAEMIRSLESAKTQLMVSLKQRESERYKAKLEYAESDLGDFRLCFDYLAHKLSDQSENSGDKSAKCAKGKEHKSMGTAEEEDNDSKVLEGELKKVQRAYDDLTSRNKNEVSALILERNFIWNQFRKMESDYNSIQKSKNIEVEQANEKIDNLLTSMEQLQSLNNEKDEAIVKLKAELAKLESDSDKSSREISRLTKEVEVLRNLKGAPLTPVSTERPKISRVRKPPVVKKESLGSQASGTVMKLEKMRMGSTGSRRREVETIPDSDTPRLFSSRFKVPKLKNSSPSPSTM